MTRYLRKRQLRERYGNISEKTADRWRKLKRIPQPDFYQGNIPYWSEHRLDQADRKALKNWRDWRTQGDAEAAERTKEMVS